MATNKLTAWGFVFVLFTLLVSQARFTAASQSGGELRWRSVQQLFRIKRQTCADGTYDFNGRTCCKCAAGQRLVKNCVSQASDRTCDFCEKGQYNPEPNSKLTCEPCTSCDQINANLEVEEPCTTAQDAKCRCKTGHYCTSRLDASGSCRLCNPCKVCGAGGIKSACTALSDTVCNDEDETHAGRIVGSVFGVLGLVVLGGVAFFLWKRKRRQDRPIAGKPIDLLKLPPKELQPYLPDLVNVIGWNDMQEIAQRSNIPQAKIEFCQHNHPRNTEEQAKELLHIWVENEGMNGSLKLIQMLQNSQKRDKAEKVMHILYGNSAIPDETA